MATAAPEIPVLARDLAFERLYRRYVKDVYHYALALLRNPADAEDVTQTTFMNAYRAIKRGEEPRKPQNWLIKIAHNAARSRYARSTRRVKEVPLDDHLDALIVPEDEKADVAEVLEALGQLPLNQRAALVMRELEGRSYGEIAEAIGVSVPAVETLIFRARRSLRVNASSVRALGAVQVPPALLQLFGGGNVVAGGGAAIGTGFLLKAAVVVVAGAVATSVVGGDRTPAADAAPSGVAVAAPPWQGVGAYESTVAFRSHAGSPGGTVRPSRLGALAAVGVQGAAIAMSDPAVKTDPARPQPVDATHETGPSASGPSVPTPAPAVPVKPVGRTVRHLPPLVPELPPTPSLPPVPAAPPVPAVPSVPLPAPPPLPTLP